jgi:hypothetical protein
MNTTLHRTAAVLVTAALAAAAAAQDEPLVEPQADELLRRMSSALAAAPALSFEAIIVEDQVLSNRQKIQVETKRRVWVLRPGSLRVTSDGDLEPRQCWYADGTLSLLDSRTGQYATVQVPPQIDPMLDSLVESYGLVLPLADVVVSDPYESAMRHTVTGYYVGLHRAGGRPCHHLAFRAGAVDWQVWINAEGDPLPRKLVINFIDLSGHPQWSATFDDWDLSPKLEPGFFTFEPRAGMKQVEMDRLLAGGAAGGGSE